MCCIESRTTIQLMKATRSPLLEAPMEKSQLSLKSRRRTRFATANERIPIASPLEQLPVDEWTNVWYQWTELESMRKEARETCRMLRGDVAEVSSDEESDRRPCLLALDHKTRGLEQRLCLERQRRKFLANRFVVKAQKKVSPEKLSMLAIKCTAWATDIAKEEAARDFLRAYYSQKASIVEKRPAEDQLDNGRRVKARHQVEATYA